MTLLRRRRLPADGPAREGGRATCFCEIARNLDADELRRIEALERDIALTLVAFSCRSVAPEREERLRRAMAQLGPPPSVQPADADDSQLAAIRRAETTLGFSLVAVGPA